MVPFIQGRRVLWLARFSALVAGAGVLTIG